MLLEYVDNQIEMDIVVDCDVLFDFEKTELEDINITKNDFLLKDKSVETLKNLIAVFDKLFSTDVLEIIKKVISDYDGIVLVENYKSTKNGKDKEDKNYLSYSYYFVFSLNKDINNVSDTVKNYLSNITIRFSTHVKRKQIENMLKCITKQFNFINMPPLTDVAITEFVQNIFTSLFDVIQVIENSDTFFESVENLRKDIMEILNKYQVQQLE